jgi:hypothetical protein
MRSPISAGSQKPEDLTARSSCLGDDTPPQEAGKASAEEVIMINPRAFTPWPAGHAANLHLAGLRDFSSPWPTSERRECGGRRNSPYL